MNSARESPDSVNRPLSFHPSPCPPFLSRGFVSLKRMLSSDNPRGRCASIYSGTCPAEIPNAQPREEPAPSMERRMDPPGHDRSRDRSRGRRSSPVYPCTPCTPCRRSFARCFSACHAPPKLLHSGRIPFNPATSPKSRIRFNPATGPKSRIRFKPAAISINVRLSFHMISVPQAV